MLCMQIIRSRFAWQYFLNESLSQEGGRIGDDPLVALSDTERRQIERVMSRAAVEDYVEPILRKHVTEQTVPHKQPRTRVESVRPSITHLTDIGTFMGRCFSCSDTSVRE
jgi:hypothetical protein